jgi:hypothetical protein
MQGSDNITGWSSETSGIHESRTKHGPGSRVDFDQNAWPRIVKNKGHHRRITGFQALAKWATPDECTEYPFRADACGDTYREKGDRWKQRLNVERTALWDGCDSRRKPYNATRGDRTACECVKFSRILLELGFLSACGFRKFSGSHTDSCPNCESKLCQNSHSACLSEQGVAARFPQLCIVERGPQSRASFLYSLPAGRCDSYTGLLAKFRRAQRNQFQTTRTTRF